MAKARAGIFGPISGKLGPIVGGVWKGIPYFRMAQDPQEKKPRTQAQLNNEQKFKFGNDWLVPFHPFVSVGFQNLAIGKTAIAAAFSANYKKVITGTWPDIVVDYSKVLISKGNLPGLVLPQASFASSAIVRLEWQQDYALRTMYNDQILFVAYSPELQKADGSIGAAIRRDSNYEFHLNERLVGKVLELYVGVASFDRKEISDSVYLGRIEP